LNRGGWRSRACDHIAQFGPVNINGRTVFGWCCFDVDRSAVFACEGDDIGCHHIWIHHIRVFDIWFLNIGIRIAVRIHNTKAFKIWIIFTIAIR
jgi:hypothetical protein